VTVEEWLIWTVEWPVEDHSALESLLYDIKGAVLGACGRRRDSELTPKVLSDLLPGLIAWIQGKPLSAIEAALGGDPNSTS
jgi:hypothetical protein